MSYKAERAAAATGGCTCIWTGPEAWVYYNGTVEPGSQIKLADGCPVHNPEARKSARPDRMDHELGMLYRLREKLFLAYSRTGAMIYYPSGAIKGQDDAEEPGLRHALEIILHEIKLREYP